MNQEGQERMAKMKTNNVRIEFISNEDGATLRLEGDIKGVHSGMFLLIKKIADSLDAEFDDVLRALHSMNEISSDLFKPVSKAEFKEKLTPMEEFLKEMNKPFEVF